MLLQCYYYYIIIITIVIIIIIILITILLYCNDFTLSKNLVIFNCHIFQIIFFILYDTNITTSATRTFNFPYNDFYMISHEIIMTLLQTIHTEFSYLNMYEPLLVTQLYNCLGHKR